MSDTCELCNYVADNEYFCDSAGSDVCSCHDLLTSSHAHHLELQYPSDRRHATVSNTCEYCNYVADHEYLCDPAGPDVCETCQKLSDIEGRIKETTMLLVYLKEERRKLKEQANIDHERLVHQRLPVEIMTDIFKDVMDLDHNYATKDSFCHLFILSAVCRKWRTITHSTPQFWTTLVLDLQPRAWRSRSSAPLFVKNWIDRAGDLPISINLSMPYNGTEDDAAIQIINVLNQYSDRWGELTYRGPSSELQRCSKTILPELRKLDLMPYDSIHGRDELKLHPTRLNELSIGAVELVAVNFDWYHLTKLKMGSASLSECFEALRRAPCLTHCTFRGGEGHRHIFPPPQNPIVHNNIQYLELAQGHTTDPLYKKICESLLCTSLRTLVLRFRLNRELVDMPVIVDLLVKSRCSLESLSLLYANLSESDMTSLCQGIPTLLHLHVILQRQFESTSTAKSLFTLLTEFSTVDGITEPRYLPALRSLALDEYHQDDWSHYRLLPNIFGDPAKGSPPTTTGSPANHRQTLESVKVGVICSSADRLTRIYAGIGEEALKKIIRLREAGVKWELTFGDESSRTDLIQLLTKHARW